ncbi:MAG: dihydroneopterin triphosphate 2'-epimerase [Marinobacterium sp.]|nr:dihydroneopterin triphosphate 2'-epimerase [Marinobacterium sp.]
MRLEEAVINITDLRLRTYIGFNPEELEKKQDVIINVEIAYQADQACHTDEEGQALNYKVITKAIISHVEEGRFRLLEKLTSDLLEIAMDSSMVTRASVRVDKPHALRFADSVSLTLSARRD